MIKIAIFGVNQQLSIMYDKDIEEVGGPHLTKAACFPTNSPRGILHSKLSEYDELNNMDQEIIHSLAELLERFNGPSPERLDENLNKMTEPRGLVEGLDQLNRRHSEHFEKAMALITQLKELI